MVIRKMRITICLALLLALLLKSFCIAQDVEIFEPTDDGATGQPVFGFDFSFPNVGMTDAEVHTEPLPEAVDYLRRLLGNENRAKILRIENNETIIDERNKRVAAVMRQDDGIKDVFEIGYVFKGVDENIASQVLAGKLFSGSVISRIVIRRKLPSGDVLNFSNALDPQSSFLASQIEDVIKEGEDTKVFVKVTGIRRGRKINSQGVSEKILLISGYGKVRVRNGFVRIQESGADSFIRIPLVILVFRFVDCPTVISDRASSKIENWFGNIEDIGIIQ